MGGFERERIRGKYGQILKGGKGVVRWKVWGAGLGSFRGFEGVKGAEGLRGGRQWGRHGGNPGVPEALGPAAGVGEAGSCGLEVAGEFEL